MKVFKFGGASVKDVAAYKNILELLKNYKNENLFIVISAMGKMTNAFEKLNTAYFNRNDIDEPLAIILDYHLKIMSELFPEKRHQVYNDFECLLKNLKHKLNTTPGNDFNYEYDQIVCYGELFSSLILSTYLNKNDFSNTLVNAGEIIKTDNTYREARVNWSDTTELVIEAYNKSLRNNNSIAITQGFIGNTSEGNYTTLGREGSDFTAAILAYALKANEVTIWKDVPGVLNADPKQFNETTKIDYLSYLDAIELAYYGATVIHPKTIKPLENAGIPLKVKSFINFTDEGTLISSLCHAKKPIPTYIFKFNQILISIQPRDFSFIAEKNISAIFNLLAKYNLKVNMMQNSAISFSLCVDYNCLKTPYLIEDLKKDFKIYFNENLELVTIRHYKNETIKKVSRGKEIILEQRSRNTVQMVLKS